MMAYPYFSVIVLFQGPRHLIIAGFAICSVAYFFIGPADFISTPYVCDILCVFVII